ncbi:hypothetical protein [Micromonospora inyonensis]|uniref:hypothetical protein n=1 Tax=Micromonospora inyonensis TaxID=47866 RepID=UPI00159EF833|nr:hypothetical protein [Micromonospora inyonensis]
MARRDAQPTVLDWRHCTVGDPEPCVICGKPAISRSPKGVPCHKTCAEAWNTEHQK